MGVAKPRKLGPKREEINRFLARHPSVVQKAQSTILSLRALFEASDDAIIGKNMDGTIVSWNIGAEKMYGYTAEEILGKSISVLIPPGHLNEFPEIMMRLRRGEHIKRYETKRIHKNGNVIDASITISPVKSAGEVVGACVVARDVTEQRRNQNALRQSEERFRVALRNANIVVFTQDLRLRYTWINGSSLSLAREDYLGRTDTEIFGGDDGARLTAIKEEVLRTGTESHTEVSLMLQGQRHYFDLVAEPVRDGAGTLLGLLCSGVDITRLKDSIANLQHALDEIQTLRGLLPICASCKKIMDEGGTWQVLETYIQDHSEASFSHSLCPDCIRKLYPEYHPQ